MLTQDAVDAREKLTGHAVFGPSSLPRIIDCPGSVEACMKVVPKGSSKWAEKGTMLHGVVEKELRKEPSLYSTLPIVEASWVMDCLNTVAALKEKHTGEMFIGIEAEVDLAAWGIPEVRGTADVILSSRERIDIIDWKFGSGVPVFAQDNMQALAYAAGAVGPGTDIDVHIHIVQPPLNSFTNWTVSPDIMLERVDIIEQAVRAAWEENPPLRAGLSQCRFCDCNMVCTERYNATKKDAVAVFQAMEAPTAIPDESIALLLQKATAIGQYIKDAQAYAATRITSGAGFPGFKLVAGRASRKWINEAAAKEWLQLKGFADEQLSVSKFLTAPQAEKLDPAFKKDEDFKALWKKTDGKPMLVPDTDKRAALRYGSTELAESINTNTAFK